MYIVLLACAGVMNLDCTLQGSSVSPFFVRTLLYLVAPLALVAATLVLLFLFYSAAILIRQRASASSFAANHPVLASWLTEPTFLETGQLSFTSMFSCNSRRSRMRSQSNFANNESEASRNASVSFAVDRAARSMTRSGVLSRSWLLLTWRMIENFFYCTVLVGLFLLHPSITTQLFQLFNCVQLSNGDERFCFFCFVSFGVIPSSVFFGDS